MYIQVLSFHLHQDERDEARQFCERAILGLSEFDGYISDTCLTRAEPGAFGGLIAWADWASLEAFRHSELYAKLLLSPHFTDVSDRAFGVSHSDGVTHQLDLLAVA